MRGAVILGGGALVAWGACRLLEWLASTPEQRGIRAAARRYEAEGGEVCADHVGWSCAPSLWDGRRPDVQVRWPDGSWHIEEHETTVSVGRTHSREQHRDLRRVARRRKRTSYRRVVHPA